MKYSEKVQELVKASRQYQILIDKLLGEKKIEPSEDIKLAAQIVREWRVKLDKTIRG